MAWRMAEGGESREREALRFFGLDGWGVFVRTRATSVKIVVNRFAFVTIG